MHELSIALNILEVVRRHLPPGERVRVTKIHLRLGRLSAIVPSALEACLQSVSKDTEAEGAELTFVEAPALVCCRACGRTTEIDGPPFICSACGRLEVDLVCGTESSVESIEVE